MMRAILVGSLIMTGTANADDLAKKVVGVWQMKKGDLAGRPFPEAVAQKIRLELTDKEYKLTGAESPDSGTWNLIPGTKPQGMDIKGVDGPNKGKTFLAIFEINGDEMKICYDLSGKKRPEKFETKPGTLLFVAEYKRVKE